jgi:signal peptide peptidase SppA
MAFKILSSPLVKRVGAAAKSTATTALAAVGFVSTVGFLYEYQQLRAYANQNEQGGKNQVLVIPFHKLQVVEREDQSLGRFVDQWTSSDDNHCNKSGTSYYGQRPVVMETRRLVNLLHTAAQDPHITSLYGVFGHGVEPPATGWAQWEEVRTALRVFREAHRRHPSPQLQETNTAAPPAPKPMYAYADTFSSLGNPANTDYYLASIFTHVHMQSRGEVNVLGLCLQPAFLRELLERNGVVVHVFKHGLFKNAPDVLTEYHFNPSHYYATQQLLKSLDESMAHDVLFGNNPHDLSSSTNANLDPAKPRTPSTLEKWFRRHEKALIAQAAAAAAARQRAAEEEAAAANPPKKRSFLVRLFWGSGQVKSEVVAAPDAAPATDVLLLQENELNGEDMIRRNIWLWEQIHNAGTWPAVVAYQAGLVDYLPKRDPLPALLQAARHRQEQEQKSRPTEAKVTEAVASPVLESEKNEVAADPKDEMESSTSLAALPPGDATPADSVSIATAETTIATDASAAAKEKSNDPRADWTDHETNFEDFKSTSTISLSQYAKQLAKRERQRQKWEYWHEKSNRNSLVNALMTLAGFKPRVTSGSTADKEKIALLYLNGTLDYSVGNKAIDTIRQIGHDQNVKAVVVRVDSRGGMISPCESISQELRSLKVPVIVSFGNYAASGGYYISACADRIFSSEKTITGSIGVFGIRLDLSPLAKQYGINIDQISTGKLSSLYSPWSPMTNPMKEHMAYSIDRHYHQFKMLVSEGRNLDGAETERLAQGRVWTGEQAKKHGLVDEIGGLHRAIAYARRTYCTTPMAEDDHRDAVEVVVYPPRESFREKLNRLVDEGNVQGTLQLMRDSCQAWLTGQRHPVPEPQTVLPTDPAAASKLVNALVKSSSAFGSPSSTLTGAMFTADEDTALQCLLAGVTSKTDNSLPDEQDGS